MPFKNEEAKLLRNPQGICKLNDTLEYIVYTKDNWEKVSEFCEPFSIEKSKIGSIEGRAVIDLPSGNETFNYGGVLVRIGNKRIVIFSLGEFVELFSFADDKN
ncbi:hypothetical protein [Candidatus Enterococcus murrayae]|uniref:Uncharacterized protein n=1 Tax=Candidatus Enterococcus murrayae TaxID=2815321 RepID=A0ABS3HNP8_9ENTE|nr:hypothetical protein [Enterococcus sp. MJM16]MBO0455068.1 hypothetical protein [Enterococcus sp. MJM16]